MLSLDSPEWLRLEHAYGDASDIPALLKQLSEYPSGAWNEDPWFSVWSALAHQGDVYSASFAAVPHVIQAIERAPERIDFQYFQFPAWVEICRYRKNITVPRSLEQDYFQALRQLPRLVGAVTEREWDESFLKAATSALSVGKGFVNVASAMDERNDE